MLLELVARKVGIRYCISLPICVAIDSGAGVYWAAPYMAQSKQVRFFLPHA